MAYLGNTLQVAYPSYRVIDDISSQFNGVLKTFALKIDGVAPVPFPINPQQCLISVNGVIQKPDSTGAAGFTLTGTNIVFASAPSSGWAFFGTVLAGADYVNVGANFPSGSAAVPSVTFDQSTTTGLYLVSTNILGISTSGVQQLTIDSSGNVSITGIISSAAGTATNPGHKIGTGTTYAPGIYSPGTDQLALATNGTGRLFIDSSGRLGLGTSAPGAALDVAGNIRAISAAPVIYINNTSSQYAIKNSSDSFTIEKDGNERLRIDSSGRLGLGTSNPSYTLDVSGTARITSVSPLWLGTTTGDSYIQYGANATTTNNWTVGSQADGTFRFFNGTYASGTERLRITSAGNVGIGSTAPSNTFQVGSEFGVNGGVVYWGSALTGNNRGMLSWGTNLATIESPQNIAFFTNSSERGRWTSDGKFLVGTSTARSNIFNVFSPYFQLEGGAAAGSDMLSVTRNTADIYGPHIILGKSRGTGNTLVASQDIVGTHDWVGNDGSNFIPCARIEGYIDGTPGTNDMPGRLVFSTTADGASSPTERMRITQAGNTFVGYSSSSAIESEVFGVQGTSTLMGRFTNNTNTSGYHGIRTSIGSNGNNTSTYHFSGNTSGVNNWYLWGNGTTTYSSDERLKKNIETTRDGYLEDIKQLRVVKYNWKNHEDGTPKELGLIAQEVAQVFPGLVQDDVSPVSDEDPTLYKQLKGSVLSVILLKALQEAVEKIETLEAKVAALEAA